MSAITNDSQRIDFLEKEIESLRERISKLENQTDKIIEIIDNFVDKIKQAG